MRSVVLAIVVSLSLLFSMNVVSAKPFKRVLVISGGGVNPGLGLGVIAGAQEMGWRPDLIIVTCGSGMGAAINNTMHSIRESFDVLRSREFFHSISQVVIANSNGIEIMEKLEEAKNIYRYPSVFEGALMYAPAAFPRFLNHYEFNRDPAYPRVIMLSARALFEPYQVGQIRDPEPLFQQVYFTDVDTAQYLKGWTLPKQASHPYTMVARQTQVITKHDTLTALRASIADPYFLNPSLLDGSYYFTGAVDLYPLDLAVALGDEVMATYPAALFQDYENVAIKSGFGFTQTTKALEAIQHRDVKWIDISGLDDYGFNPTRFAVIIKSGIPSDFSEFQLGVGRQWDFGRERTKEALRVAPGTKTDIRYHLRRPINPKLFEEFSCQNAYEWRTDRADSCVSDSVPKCNRRLAKSCTPIR